MMKINYNKIHTDHWIIGNWNEHTSDFCFLLHNFELYDYRFIVNAQCFNFSCSADVKSCNPKSIKKEEKQEQCLSVLCECWRIGKARKYKKWLNQVNKTKEKYGRKSTWKSKARKFNYHLRNDKLTSQQNEPLSAVRLRKEWRKILSTQLKNILNDKFVIFFFL